MQLAAWLKRLIVSNSLISGFIFFFSVNVFIVEGYNKESNVDDLIYQKYQIFIFFLSLNSLLKMMPKDLV